MIVDKETLEKIFLQLKQDQLLFSPTAITLIIQKTNDPFWILITCLLSLRTKEAITKQAIIKLYERAKNPEDILNLPSSEIIKLIYPVGFYRKKSEIIKEVSRKILSRFEGKVPNNFSDLNLIKGIGRKTANLVLGRAFQVPAIAVDTHVHRISNRLGFVKTISFYQTELDLLELIPEKYWIEVNELLVTLGQNICLPLKPSCYKCSISKYCLKIL